jgi:hypothetical protein
MTMDDDAGTDRPAPDAGQIPQGEWCKEDAEAVNDPPEREYGTTNPFAGAE